MECQKLKVTGPPSEEACRLHPAKKSVTITAINTKSLKTTAFLLNITIPPDNYSRATAFTY
jgi:hypothetical protein